jgi:hypothetical protein
MKIEKNEIKSTAHSKYRCQYHIVFAPKYRRKEIYGTLKRDIGEILRKLCEQKGVEIIEAEACPDHIHMLVSIPPHLHKGTFGTKTFCAYFFVSICLLAIAYFPPHCNECFGVQKDPFLFLKRGLFLDFDGQKA